MSEVSMAFFNRRDPLWKNVGTIEPAAWRCGYCGERVASNQGYFVANLGEKDPCIRVCPNCVAPTFFDAGGTPHPTHAPGREVSNLPPALDRLYREARKAAAAGAPTAAVLTCRTILMHVAVEEGATPSGPFLSYVEHLAKAGFIPPNGRGWVDYIRQRGNEAAHEIVEMTPQDANQLIAFVEMLLIFIYEFPNRIPSATPA